MSDIIAERDGFALLSRGANKEWLNLKLTAPGREKKQNWWLAWNGARLAESSDARLLQQHLPHVHEWVSAVLLRLGPVAGGYGSYGFYRTPVT